MGTAGIIKVGMIILGSAVMISGIWLLALKKLTDDFGVVWELVGGGLILTALLPALSGWTEGIQGTAVWIFFGGAVFILLAAMGLSLLLSQMMMKNQELAILASMLLWENKK